MNSLAKAFGLGALVLLGFSSIKAQNNNNPCSANPDSCFNVALAAERFFLSEKDPDYAEIAIDNYGKYYEADTQGKYPCTALMRRVLLYEKIGKYEDSRAELNRIKESSKCSDLYARMIRYLENKLKRNGENNK